MKIIDYLLENPDDKDFDFATLLHGSMTGKVDSIRLALDGMITEEQQQKMNIILCHFSEVKKCKADLESLILSLSEPYTRQCSLVSTVPGIKNLFSVIAII